VEMGDISFRDEDMVCSLWKHKAVASPATGIV